MPEPTASSAPGSDAPADSTADETSEPRTPFSWPARVALVAAAGLVAGGVAFTANEVAAALAPSAPYPAVAEEDDETPSERRTTALTGTAQPEDPEGSEGAENTEGTEGEQGAEYAGDAPAQGADGTAGAPGGGEPAPGPLSEGDPGWVDPREEILEGILNTPQDRSPMEPQITQEELDAMREAAEAEVETVVP